MTLCADGYSKNSSGICVLPPAVCEVGYKSDGNGHCIPSSIHTICATGYESAGNGNCLLIAPVTENPQPTTFQNAQNSAVNPTPPTVVSSCVCSDEVKEL